MNKSFLWASSPVSKYKTSYKYVHLRGQLDDLLWTSATGLPWQLHLPLLHALKAILLPHYEPTSSELPLLPNIFVGEICPPHYSTQSASQPIYTKSYYINKKSCQNTVKYSYCGIQMTKFFGLLLLLVLYIELIIYMILFRIQNFLSWWRSLYMMVMALLQVWNGEECLQIRTYVNTLKKQLQTENKAWSTAFKVGMRPTTPHHKQHHYKVGGTVWSSAARSFKCNVT